MRRFKDEQTERVFLGHPVRRLPADIQRRARVRLQRVVTAGALYCMTCAYRRHIGWKRCAVTEWESTASVSITSGECVSSGPTKARRISKSLIIIDVEEQE